MHQPPRHQEKYDHSLVLLIIAHDTSKITAQLHTLRQLLKEKTKFHWGKEQESSFLQLKQAITSAPILAHYKLSAPTRVVVDASPWAVGAVLLQQQPDSTYRPIAYGSRSLTETEMKYSQIEKEALAIVFGCEHFHTYVYGRSFELETDHRPLEHIFKPKSSENQHQPGWKDGYSGYKNTIFTVIYRPGPQNLADAFQDCLQSCREVIWKLVRTVTSTTYIAEQLTPKAMHTAEIQEHSKDDPELTQVRQCIITNQRHKLPQQYKQLADELCIVENIILRDNRIILPLTLRNKAVCF